MIGGWDGGCREKAEVEREDKLGVRGERRACEEGCREK